MAIMVGIGTGLNVRSTIIAQFTEQVRATILTLTSIDNLLIFVGVACTLLYFIMTIERRGLLRHVSRIGLWFMMVAFGTAFGAGMVGRISYFISIVRFLLADWLGVVT